MFETKELAALQIELDARLARIARVEEVRAIIARIRDVPSEVKDHLQRHLRYLALHQIEMLRKEGSDVERMIRAIGIVQLPPDPDVHIPRPAAIEPSLPKDL